MGLSCLYYTSVRNYFNPVWYYFNAVWPLFQLHKKISGCGRVPLAEDPFVFFERLQTYRINPDRFLE